MERKGRFEPWMVRKPVGMGRERVFEVRVLARCIYSIMSSVRSPVATMDNSY